MLSQLYQKEAERILALDLEDSADLEHPVMGEGNFDSPLIMFIGEAPGREEAACGRPFVGKAGKQLDKMLLTAGIDRSKVFVTNAVKYRPITLHERTVCNRTPSVKEIKGGLPVLLACVLVSAAVGYLAPAYLPWAVLASLVVVVVSRIPHVIDNWRTYKLDRHHDYKKAVETLTPESVSRFIREKMLGSGNHVEVVMLPE